MFGDGKIDVINQDGELFVNMWQLVQHLINSSFALEDSEGVSDVSMTLRIISATLCDLALYELGMESLNEFENVQELIDMWDSHRE